MNIRYPKLPANGGPQLQAVILAGGRGERLRPITDNIPKPMVEVGGLPFIHHLILQLRSFGITDVLILAGYKANVVVDYFDKTSIPNVNVAIVKAPETFSKSERIMAAKESIASKFMLLYSDNFSQFNIRDVINHPANNIVTVCTKTPGNVFIDNQSMKVNNFLYKRRSEETSYIEIGYSKFDKADLFEEIKNSQDLDVAISNLAKKGNLYASESHEGYLSISDPVRLQNTKKVFDRKDIILIDRDGVINQKPEKANYITDVKQISYISETIEFMNYASDAYSKKFIVISNQAGIARGIMTKEQVDVVNTRIRDDLKKKGIDILAFFYCPHGWDDGCSCRKPNPGLLFKASKEYGFVLGNTCFIGDDIRDVEAAIKAGTRAVLVGGDIESPRIPNVRYVNNLYDNIDIFFDESEL